jgi:tetratricopeptide (TPR) repeat protein
MLNKFKKNQLFTAAAAASVLTVAPVYAATISLYRFPLDRNDRVSVNNSTFPHGPHSPTDRGLGTIIPVQPELILPVRAESPVNNSLVQNTGANEYFQQGLNFAAQQDTASAEAAFRRAIQIDPNFAEAYANLGSILANQNKLAEAVPNFETAIRLKPKVPEFYYMLGKVLSAQNKKAEAVESVKKARDLYRNQGKTQAANKLDEVIKNLSK